MKFFRELEPDVYLGVGKLETEQDGHDWTGEYDALLARGRLMAIIVTDGDRPLPPAGKPMILWMKTRKAELARLVAGTVHVIEDEEERGSMERALPGRAKASPYPVAIAATEAEALEKARVILDHAVAEACAAVK
ncbi:hypothetical protein ACVCNR_12660 [Aquamicrobium terrae]